MHVLVADGLQHREGQKRVHAFTDRPSAVKFGALKPDRLEVPRRPAVGEGGGGGRRQTGFEKGSRAVETGDIIFWF